VAVARQVSSTERIARQGSRTRRWSRNPPRRRRACSTRRMRCRSRWRCSSSP